MREKILFATWKNRVGYVQSQTLANQIVQKVSVRNLGFRLVLCPAYVALAVVRDSVRDAGIELAAQNVMWEQRASCTGEISSQMLLEVGCKYVILGHSERRIYLGETDDMIERRVKTALESGLVPIVCVGETYDQRAPGIREAVVENQLRKALSNLTPDRTHRHKIVIAYEPSWSISTSDTATPLSPREASEMHRFVRSILSEITSADFAANTTIVYGGSVDADNARSYFGLPEVDGGLVGTATQSLESFMKLIEITQQVYRS